MEAEAVVDPEARLTEIFERGNPDVPEREEVEEAEAEEVEASDDEPEAEEADADKAQPEESDAEEVEYEGKAYKLPKELKDALLRQQDYTRKTQEVANTRKAVEQQAEEVRIQAEFQREHLPKMVEIQALDTQLQQYSQLDWKAIIESDPGQAMLLQVQQRDLQDKANRLRGELQGLAQEHGAKAAQMRQQAQARCIEEVRKDIKGFDADMLKGIDETARAFGFSGEELAQVTDPRVVKVLHAAMQYQRLQGSKAIADKKVQEVKPVRVKTASSAQTSQQGAAITAVRARLKSTGRPADAEALLTARFAKSMR